MDLFFFLVLTFPSDLRQRGAWSTRNSYSDGNLVDLDLVLSLHIGFNLKAISVLVLHYEVKVYNIKSESSFFFLL